MSKHRKLQQKEQGNNVSLVLSFKNVPTQTQLLEFLLQQSVNGKDTVVYCFQEGPLLSFLPIHNIYFYEQKE